MAPVILLTAKGNKEFMIDGLRKGADDYIAKPFDTEILASKIESVLANRRRLSKYYMDRSVRQAHKSDGDRNADIEKNEDGVELNEDDKAFVDKATAIVMRNIADSTFTIDMLCREMAMSRTLFYGRLKTLTGQSPQDFIRVLRLERAAALLKGGGTVLEVSIQTGFANVKYFSTVFKKHFGVSPSKYGKGY